MIAILGWGSLIWKPQDLPYLGGWKKGGPILPLEFTRAKTVRPLTLVLDSEKGANCCTRFAQSSRTRLADAIEDLQQREGASLQEVGYVDLQQNLSSVESYPQQINVDRIVRRWCRQNGVTAAVWTAILPNFAEELGVEFSVDAAMQYLEQLSKADKESMSEYIANTPSEINTPFRLRVEAAWAIKRGR